MKKLKLKHLAPYLPYGLKVLNTDRGLIVDVLGLQTDLDVIHNHGKTPLKFIKPILRPLSDLLKDDFDLFRSGLCYNSRIIVLMQKDLHYEWTSSIAYFDFLKLLENHFDVFNLIDNGLAIDINTL